MATVALGICISCNNSSNSKTTHKDKHIVLHWSNPDFCTNDSMFVEADVLEYCGKKEIASHHIDTLRCDQIENYEANPETDKVRIKLGLKDLREYTNKYGKEPISIPIWVRKVYEFESDTLTINFTKDDYEITSFMPK